jgi:hypothetical protein
MLRIGHCLENRSTDGNEVISLMRRPFSTPQKLFFIFLVLISIKGSENPRT